MDKHPKQNEQPQGPQVVMSSLGPSAVFVQYQQAQHVPTYRNGAPILPEGPQRDDL